MHGMNIKLQLRDLFQILYFYYCGGIELAYKISNAPYKRFKFCRNILNYKNKKITSCLRCDKVQWLRCPRSVLHGLYTSWRVEDEDTTLFQNVAFQSPSYMESYNRRTESLVRCHFSSMAMYMSFHILAYKIAYTSIYNFKPNFFIIEHSKTSYLSQDSKHLSHCFTKAG
jgi:hypothetical protein